MKNVRVETNGMKQTMAFERFIVSNSQNCSWWKVYETMTDEENNT